MNKLLQLALMTILSIPSLAQRNNVQLGIKGGLNISYFNDYDSRIGFHVGGLANIRTRNPRLAIQPELVFSAQGAEFSNGKYEVDYLNVPILLQYVGRGGLRLETGPQLGALTAAKWENDDGDEYNAKGSFKQSDFSWAFGIGYVAPSGLGLDARFNLGLSDISKGRGELNNRVWQLGLFYLFPR
jgi:hypothetical protein